MYIVSGYGTEIKWEKETQKDENGSAEIKLEQNMQKVNEDFIARTATRLGIGTEMEYRHPIHSALSAGFRLRVVSNKRQVLNRPSEGVETSVLSSGYK